MHAMHMIEFIGLTGCTVHLTYIHMHMVNMRRNGAEGAGYDISRTDKQGTKRNQGRAVLIKTISKLYSPESILSFRQISTRHIS